MTNIHDFEPLWGNWTIEGKPLGAGGSGITYKAKQNVLGYTSYCAIKHISIPASEQQLVQAIEIYQTDDDEKLHAHFRAEIEDRMQEYVSQRDFAGNQHIVQVSDVQYFERNPGPGFDLFIRMELLNKLQDKVDEKTVDEKTVIRLGLDICDALKEMHGKKVIHRDIKPQNILVADDGTFKLADFGSARVLENGETSMTGGVTPSYAAPELLKGDKADHRVDLYSLGLVLYKLLNEGILPFKTNGASFGRELPEPTRASERLTEVIRKACAYEKEDRWKTADEMGRALEACLEVVPPVHVEKHEDPVSEVEPKPENNKNKVGMSPLTAVYEIDNGKALDADEPDKPTGIKRGIMIASLIVLLCCAAVLFWPQISEWAQGFPPAEVTTEPPIEQSMTVTPTTQPTTVTQTMEPMVETPTTEPTVAPTTQPTTVTQTMEPMVETPTTEPAPTAHEHAVAVLPEKPATCTETGLSAGVWCPDCGEILVEQQEIPAKGHNWVPATVYAPKTCSTCGATEGQPLPSVKQPSITWIDAYQSNQEKGSINRMIDNNISSCYHYTILKSEFQDNGHIEISMGVNGGTVGSIIFYGGDQSSDKNYKKYSRPRQIRVYIHTNNGTYTEMLNLDDINGKQKVPLSRSYGDVKQIDLDILHTYDGTAINYVRISEIMLSSD